MKITQNTIKFIILSSLVCSMVASMGNKNIQVVQVVDNGNISSPSVGNSPAYVAPPIVNPVIVPILIIPKVETDVKLAIVDDKIKTSISENIEKTIKVNAPESYLLPDTKTEDKTLNKEEEKKEEESFIVTALNVDDKTQVTQSGGWGGIVNNAGILNFLNNLGSATSSQTVATSGLIEFSLIPAGWQVPVSAPIISKVARFVSGGEKQKFMINDPNPEKDIPIDLVGSLLYLLVAPIWIGLMGLRVLKSII
jgi:hypothetical protein